MGGWREVLDSLCYCIIKAKNNVHHLENLITESFPQLIYCIVHNRQAFFKIILRHIIKIISGYLAS